MARIGSFLSLDALRSGLREQYAVRRSYGTVVVELALENDRFVVSERITQPGQSATSTATSHTLLGEAHNELSRLIRKHP